MTLNSRPCSDVVVFILLLGRNPTDRNFNIHVAQQSSSSTGNFRCTLHHVINALTAFFYTFGILATSVFWCVYAKVQNVVLYNEDDIRQLDWELNCWEKEAVIPSERVVDEIVAMSFYSSRSGCSYNGSNGEPPIAPSGNLTCQGERRFDSPRKVCASSCLI